jgi:hypothetical protein
VTLKSYSKIKWKKVHLRIRLDTEFEPRRTELAEFIHECFGPVDLEYKRYEHQHEWRSLIEQVCAEDDLVWFTQNDDHVFVEPDTAYLETGLELLRKDPAVFKTIYFSHWPEILRLSGKLGPPERVGQWVRFKCTLVDAIQIMNSNFLKFLFLDLDWHGAALSASTPSWSSVRFGVRGTSSNPSRPSTYRSKSSAGNSMDMSL